MQIMPYVSRSLHSMLAHMTLSQLSTAVAVEFLLAFGCGAIMERKGRSNVVGFVIAFAFNIVGIAIVLWWPPKNKRVAVREQADRHRVAVAPKITNTGRSVRAQMRTQTVDHKACPCCSVPVPANSDVCRVCQHDMRTSIAV